MCGSYVLSVEEVPSGIETVIGLIGASYLSVLLELHLKQNNLKGYATTGDARFLPLPRLVRRVRDARDRVDVGGRGYHFGRDPLCEIGCYLGNNTGVTCIFVQMLSAFVTQNIVDSARTSHGTSDS